MLSIVIPHAGATEPLKECIEGVKKNTSIPYEIVVVADKPSNETRKYLAKEEGVGAIFNPKIMGVEPALNKGFKKAKGELLCLLTVDVKLPSGSIKALADALEAELSFGWVAISSEHTGFFVACSMMTREAFEKVGPWDESYTIGYGFSDDDYLRRMWKAGYKPHIVEGPKVSHTGKTATAVLRGEKEAREGFTRAQALFQKRYNESGTDWESLPKYQLPLELHRIEWIKSRISLDDKVCEIGVAENPVFGQTPFKVVTLDKSVRPNERCFPDVVGVAEALPFGDKTFDVANLGELLEHVPDPQVVLKEACRVSRKKVIVTVPAEHLWTKELKPFWNPGHVRFYTRQTFQQELEELGLPYKIELIRYGDWRHFGAEIYCDGGETVEVEKPNLVKLNLGSFVDIVKGWTNIDILPLREHIPPDVEFRQWDLRRGIPYPNESVHLIRCSHLIEHLTLEEAKNLMAEMFRVLVPGGLARTATPDARVIVRHFMNNDMSYFNAVEQPTEYIMAPTQCEKLSRLLFSGDYSHRAVYDFDSLKNFLEQAGFSKIFRSAPGFSHAEAMQMECEDAHIEISLFVEAVK